MRHILLRSPKDPFEVVSPEETLDRNLIGSNSGNLIFLEASYKILATRGTTVTPDRFRARPGQAAEINERYDAYVIPLANAFRPSFEPHLIRLTRVIERLTIPVVILGVGAQSTVRYDHGRLSRIDTSVKSFVSAVLDHAPSIGVRGEFTHDYLRALGFRDVEVIGCPSMFLNGDRMRIEKRIPELLPDSRLAMNVSPYVKAMGDIVMSHVAKYPNLTYVAQDIASLELMLWGEPPKQVDQGSKLPVHRSHPLFSGDKARFFVDPWPWLEHLATYDFSFGTRIHGNIAALVAGIPAYVLAHDSRTLELARYFGIPHRPMTAVSPTLDAAELYAEADYGELNRGHAARFATFTGYLERHGLGHVFAEGEDPAAFDERIAAIEFPPAVRVRHETRLSGVTQRVRRVERRTRRYLTTAKWAKRYRAALARRWGRLTRRRSSASVPKA
jgi:hypothetical protein